MSRAHVILHKFYNSVLQYIQEKDIFIFHIRAPELFEVPSECVIDSKTDVWSLGCTLYAMAYGMYSICNPVFSYYQIFNMSYNSKQDYLG